jgi:hypothetical protein
VLVSIDKYSTLQSDDAGYISFRGLDPSITTDPTHNLVKELRSIVVDHK